MTKTFSSIAVGIALACGCIASASAQYSWLDKDGRKVYSDRPPPSGISEKDVLRRPNMAAGARQAAVPASAGSAETRAAKPDQAQEMAAKMKQADDAEAARKQSETDRVARVKSENCLRAQQAQATYASGVPLSHVNAQGEREQLSDAARSLETERLGSIMASNCH